MLPLFTALNAGPLQNASPWLQYPRATAASTQGPGQTWPRGLLQPPSQGVLGSDVTFGYAGRWGVMHVRSFQPRGTFAEK